jgi:hypothetical protein
MKSFNESVQPIVAIFNKIDDEGLHGDVIITLVKAPKGFASMVLITDDCLAYGEATGHAHKLFGGEFELRECPKTKTRHLHVIREVVLKHQEHNPIIIPPGHFRIGIQQEYDPFEKLSRKVID